MSDSDDDILKPSKERLNSSRPNQQKVNSPPKVEEILPPARTSMPEKVISAVSPKVAPLVESSSDEDNFGMPNIRNKL